MKKKLNILVLAGVLLAIAAGVSYAAIPSSNGTISACKDNKGALKVIDAEAGQTCNTNQQLLTWNQQGPQGPPGSAVGYAFVAHTGDVLEGRSLNVGDANVSKPVDTHGVYCFNGLPFTPKVATVTPARSGLGAGSGAEHPMPEIGFAQACPESAFALSVLMLDPSTGYPTRDQSFFVLFN